MANPIEWITGDFGDKKRWRAYKARVKALPKPYRESVDALERYLMYFGSTDGDHWLDAFDDLVELFEGAAADDTRSPSFPASWPNRSMAQARSRIPCSSCRS